MTCHCEESFPKGRATKQSLTVIRLLIGIATGFAFAMTDYFLNQSHSFFSTPANQGVSPEIQGFYLPVIGVNPLFHLFG
jgi:hypothetical protein